MISVIAKATAQDGKRDELVAAFQELMDHVENEEGTLTYILVTDDQDENTVWFYEEYHDGDALAAHGASEAMKEIGPKLGAVLAGRPEVRVCTPVRRKGE